MLFVSIYYHSSTFPIIDISFFLVLHPSKKLYKLQLGSFEKKRSSL